jgi:hypothetical protein
MQRDSWVEAFAATDGRDLEVQRGVAGVAALVHQLLGPFARHAYLDQLLVTTMRFSKVAAESALSLFDFLHVGAPVEFRGQSASARPLPWGR